MVQIKKKIRHLLLNFLELQGVEINKRDLVEVFGKKI